MVNIAFGCSLATSRALLGADPDTNTGTRKRAPQASSSAIIMASRPPEVPMDDLLFGLLGDDADAQKLFTHLHDGRDLDQMELEIDQIDAFVKDEIASAAPASRKRPSTAQELPSLPIPADDPGLHLGALPSLPAPTAPVLITPSGRGPFSCWGAEVKGTCEGCIPDFVPGKAHFKNKFCARCREGVDVPADRVRALTQEQRESVFNSLQSGFWKRAPVAMGGGEVRIVNNTITCDGPWVAVFKEEAPPIGWETMPPKWTNGGVVRLMVAKGTLVPVSEIYASRRAPAPFPDNMAKRRRRQGPREEVMEAEATEVVASSGGFSSLGGAAAAPPAIRTGPSMASSVESPARESSPRIESEALASPSATSCASPSAASRMHATSSKLASLQSVESLQSLPSERPTTMESESTTVMGEDLEVPPLRKTSSSVVSCSSVVSSSMASSMPISIDALCEQLANAQMAVRQVIAAGLAPDSGLHLDEPLRAQLQTQLQHTQADLIEMQRLAGLPSGHVPHQRPSDRSQDRYSGASAGVSEASASVQSIDGRPAMNGDDRTSAAGSTSSAHEGPPNVRNSLGDQRRSMSEGSQLTISNAANLSRGGPAAAASSASTSAGAQRVATDGPTHGASPRRVSFMNLFQAKARHSAAKEHYTETIGRYSGVRRGASDSRMLDDTSRKSSLTAQLRRVFGLSGSPETPLAPRKSPSWRPTGFFKGVSVSRAVSER